MSMPTLDQRTKIFDLAIAAVPCGSPIESIHEAYLKILNWLTSPSGVPARLEKSPR